MFSNAIHGRPLAALSLLLAACSDPGTNAVADTTGQEVAEGDTGGGDTSGGDTGGGDTGAPDSAPDSAPAETTPPADEARVELLSDQEVLMTLGFSGPVTIEVPAGVVAITISVVGDAATYYGLGSWTGPGGFELVTPGWANSEEGQGGLCLSCKNRIALSGAAFATLAPNNPASEVTAGAHTFSLFGYTPPVVVEGQGSCGDDICHTFDQFQCQEDCRATTAFGPVRVLVHAKLADAGLPAHGVLDLNLHFTGAQGLSAELAQSDAEFQRMLDSMRAIYAQVGVSLGDIRYRDIDASYKVIESLDGADSDLQAMFAESDGNPNALNLFFVDELSAAAFGGFGVILGIAGGIPGPPLLQGSGRSGVAIAIKPVQGAPAGIDTTMAHETGHFLGLFHSSEVAFFGPQIHDPLPDTRDNDEGNLMFNTGAGNVLSEWQGRVMRANPWVRHPATP